jgi:hypothetical protein
VSSSPVSSIVAVLTRAAPSGSGVSEGNTVIADGLPADTLVNFMITEAAGTSGWVLGHTSSGHWQVGVPERAGASTYEFVGRMYGKSGSKYRVFASCSAPMG